MNDQLTEDQKYVIQASRSHNKTERYLACKKLGQESNRNALGIWTALTERLIDPDKDVRRAASTALGVVSRQLQIICTAVCVVMDILLIDVFSCLGRAIFVSRICAL